LGQNGWTFEPGPDVIADPQLGARYLREIYTAANPAYTGRVTVPVLWDRVHRTIVNNESSEIILEFAGLQHRAHVIDSKIDECPDSRRQSALRGIDNVSG